MNTKDTPIDYEPTPWNTQNPSYEDVIKENISIKLELQKQKELNAELVIGLQYIKKTLGALTISQDTPEGQAYNEAESLIKKSSET